MLVTGCILFGVLVVMLMLSVPIPVSIALAAIASYVYSGIDLQAFVQRMYASVDSFPLMAIPFFMMAGSIMESGGMSRRLVRLANCLVGWLTGGLAYVAVLACGFFAALSGSSPATCAAIGGVMIPEMIKYGYPADFTGALLSVAATVGPIIPPSIPLVIYGVVTGESIGKLFAGGILPGIVFCGSLMVAAYLVSRRREYPRQKRATARELWDALRESIWALLVPVIILGGIYGGVFTPTEAGSVAVVYGLVVGIFVYRELTLKNISRVLNGALANTAMVMLIVAASGAFSWMITKSGVARAVGLYLVNLAGSRALFLGFTMLLCLFLGCFMETISILLIVVPILYPVAMQLGVDPIHFGIVLAINLCIGMATPPVGENLYIASKLSGIKLETLVRAELPFLLAALAALAASVYWPDLVLWIPRLIYR